MTTKITVDAHAGWPVRVDFLHAGTDQEYQPSVHVPAGSQQDFHITDAMGIRITELDSDGGVKVRPVFTAEELQTDSILRFFQFDHLPEHLQARSAEFAYSAQRVIRTTPRNPERTIALRKLLEAKDAAVRAALPE